MSDVFFLRRLKRPDWHPKKHPNDIFSKDPLPKSSGNGNTLKNEGHLPLSLLCFRGWSVGWSLASFLTSVELWQPILKWRRCSMKPVDEMILVAVSWNHLDESLLQISTGCFWRLEVDWKKIWEINKRPYETLRVIWHFQTAAWNLEHWARIIINWLNLRISQRDIVLAQNRITKIILKLKLEVISSLLNKFDS